MIDIATVERAIVRRLAEGANRDASDLERELRSADRDLPIEDRALVSILGALEADFDVTLQTADASGLHYVHELAILILGRIARHAGAASELSAALEEPPAKAKPTSDRQPRARRRARAPRARRSASAG